MTFSLKGSIRTTQKCQHNGNHKGDRHIATVIKNHLKKLTFSSLKNCSLDYPLNISTMYFSVITFSVLI